MEITIAGLAFLVGYGFGFVSALSKCSARIERMKKIIDSLMSEMVKLNRMGVNQ